MSGMKARRFTLAMLSSITAVMLSITFAPIATAESVVDCDFNLDWPHQSVHVPGSISSNAVIKCNSSKAYLGVEVVLIRDGMTVGYNRDKNNSGIAVYTSAAASVPECVPGNYLAKAEFLMVEHNETRHERSHQTPSRSIACGPCVAPGIVFLGGGLVPTIEPSRLRNGLEGCG